MAPASSIKIIKVIDVSPHSDTVQESSLPLTLFDIHNFPLPPVRILLCFDFPHSLDYFLQSVLPELTIYLSLTLQYFFPLASRLILPPSPHHPYILYSPGDSLALTVAESSADFDHITNNHARNVNLFSPLVPKLPSAHLLDDGTNVASLMAIQVTLFPNSGISIGFTFDHVVADGMAFIHFVKSWGSLCRTKGCVSFIEKLMPCHKRSEVQDPNGLGVIFMKQFWSANMSCSMRQESHLASDAIFMVCFTMSRGHIERLKKYISMQIMRYKDSMSLHVSSFAVTCALAWVCLLKTRMRRQRLEDKDMYLFFPADCRNRLGSSIPSTYFGNCLVPCGASAKMHELLSNNGIVEAVKAIASKMRELRHEGPLKGAEKWFSQLQRIAETKTGQVIAVDGSPKMSIYDTDFGWGRATKCEPVHITPNGIALANCREGGIEISLALSEEEFKVFKSTFENEIKKFLLLASF